MTVEAQFSDALSWFDPSEKSAKLGVAVSGGSDSMALLELAAAHFPGRVRAATVDHRLRAEATQEALSVSLHCARLGVTHDTLVWDDGWSGQGNLQAEARTARYDLLTGWAERHNLAPVLLGHTADDQAETILMRLARGSGVDGLAGMPVRSGIFFRPLLACNRADLQTFLRAREVTWVDDPSNDDTRFDRVKARKMMTHLSELGLTQERLGRLGEHMRKAEKSLWQLAQTFARTHVTEDRGDLILSPQALQLHHGDTEARILAAAVQWVTGTVYRPRFEALQEAVRDVQAGKQRTLAGALFCPENKGLRLTREPAAAKITIPADSNGTIWDKRWHISGPARPGYEVRALGDALKECPDWRSSGLPRASLLASPAVFDGNKLISAPLAGLNPEWDAQIVASFRTYLESH